MKKLLKKLAILDHIEKVVDDLEKLTPRFKWWLVYNAIAVVMQIALLIFFSIIWVIVKACQALWNYNKAYRSKKAPMQVLKPKFQKSKH
jgi:hypothetical protein